MCNARGAHDHIVYATHDIDEAREEHDSKIEALDTEGRKSNSTGNILLHMYSILWSLFKTSHCMQVRARGVRLSVYTIHCLHLCHCYTVHIRRSVVRVTHPHMHMYITISHSESRSLHLLYCIAGNFRG